MSPAHARNLVEHATKSSTGFSARLASILACIAFSSSAAFWLYW